MDQHSRAFVGIDTSKLRNAVAVAEEGRGGEATLMARMKYDFVREWIDKKTGRLHRQFRRRGYKRIMLKGLPGSKEFRLAYESALGAPAMPVGAKRTLPGTVNDALARYYDSHEFRIALAPATQKMRRAVLEAFRNDHGDRYIAELPAKFILLSLAALGPFAARNWMKALRGLIRFAIAAGMCERDPTYGIKLPKVKSDGYPFCFTASGVVIW